MVLTLALLRHAKSSWADPSKDDFSRELAPRGIAAAHGMGNRIGRYGPLPDLVLCSSAVRTRATLDLILPYLAASPPALTFEDDLYLASARDLLGRVRSLSSRWPRVMVIGHNPGFHDFAQDLSGTGDAALRANLARKYPTAALAVLSFDADRWSTIEPAQGHLSAFVTPSSLA